MALLVGLDSGLTTTKAVVFDCAGEIYGRAALPTPQSSPRPHWMQRDATQHWRVVAAVLKGALADAAKGTRKSVAAIASSVIALAVAAHGDGLCLVDKRGQPVGPMMLFTDTRATDIMSEWQAKGIFEEILQLTGQIPLVGGPPALLAWKHKHEPSSLSQARWLLSPKDWLRFNLTGTFGTDRTDAAAAFTEIGTDKYSTDVAEIYGFGDIVEKLPPISEPSSIIGTITRAAARLTDLLPGTPVAAGIHDIQACLLGATGGRSGEICVIGGTVSTNLVLTSSPVRDRTLVCRTGPWEGSWTLVAVSTASSANLDWALSRLINGGAKSPTGGLMSNEAVDAALEDGHPAGTPIYVPYLFGGPSGSPGSAALLGMRSWHDQNDIIRAIVEGVTFNHRSQIQHLLAHIDVTGVHLSGGASSNQSWAQLFADVLRRPVSVPAVSEVGALGAAMCAATGAGIYPSLSVAAQTMSRTAAVNNPNPAQCALLESAYSNFLKHVALLSDDPLDSPVRESMI